MARVRGRLMVPLRAFIKENFGEVGWQRLLCELSPPYRETLDGLLLPSSWYPREMHNAFLHAVDRLFRADLPDLGEQLGARSATYNVRFFLKPLLRVGGPMLVIKRLAGLYREHFDTGQMVVVERREKGARIKLDDPHVPALFCSQTFLGFVRAVIRTSGRKVERCEQVMCRHTGSPHCEIEVEWK